MMVRTSSALSSFLEHPHDERAIHFKGVGVEALKVSERRVAGAEVVYV
jgi:hypothetical protein